MSKTAKKHDYQKENEEKLVEALYQSTLKNFPGIPIPDEELAKELLRVGVKAGCGMEEIASIKNHLTPYSAEEIVKIQKEKMQLVTVTEFNILHKEKLEAERKLAKAVESLRSIKYRTERNELDEYYRERNHDIRKDAVEVLAEIGGKDD